MNDTKKLTKTRAKRVLKIVDAGLCSGLGKQKLGEMCVEAAVCFAYNLPHGDNPPCVGVAVRVGKITLNDSNWSSNNARSKGMRKIAIAQLGSDQIDQVEYAKRLALKTIQEIVPLALRAAAGMKGNESHETKLEAAATACESVKDLSAASDAARYAASDAACAAYAARCAASDAACAARYAASDAACAARYAASAARYAACAASGAASAASGAACAARYAASDAASGAACAARYAASDAASAASGAASAASDAACAARYAASDAASDAALTKAADIQLSVLIELNSPGCKYLSLCDTKGES